MGLCQSDTREQGTILILPLKNNQNNEGAPNGIGRMISSESKQGEKLQDSDYMFRTNINLNELNRNEANNHLNNNLVEINHKDTYMHLQLPENTSNNSNNNNNNLLSPPSFSTNEKIKTEEKKASTYNDNMPQKPSIYHRRISQLMMTKSNTLSQNNIPFSQNVINEETYNSETEEKEEQNKKLSFPPKIQTSKFIESSFSLKKSHHENDSNNISKFNMNSSNIHDSRFFQNMMEEVDQMKEELLYVITVITNACQNPKKVQLYQDFMQKMDSLPNVKTITVEINYLALPFILTQPHCEPYNIQFRVDSPLNLKYNALNYVVSILPPEAEFIAWIDYNIEFLNENWVENTIELLNNPNCHLVKLYSDFFLVGKDSNNIIGSSTSAIKNPKNQKAYAQYQRINHLDKYSGTAWAGKKEFITNIGGFLDLCVTNESDLLINACFEGKIEEVLPNNLPFELKEILKDWQQQIKMSKNSDNLQILSNICKKFILDESYESPKKTNNNKILNNNSINNSLNNSNRKSVGKSKNDEIKEYLKFDGWELMADFHFNPLKDLVRDHQNMYMLKRDKERMFKSFKEYFLNSSQFSI